MRLNVTDGKCGEASGCGTNAESNADSYFLVLRCREGGEVVRPRLASAFTVLK